MKRILCSDWLSERARSARLAGPSCVGPAGKISLFGHFDQVCFIKMAECWPVLFCVFLLCGFTGKILVF